MSINDTSGLLTVSDNPPIQLFYTLNRPLSLDPKKPVIILSNSLASATWLWEDFVNAFSEGYTIIRYDSRFHGQSPLPSTPHIDYERGHTIEDLASDVVKLLDHLGVQEVEAFIGLSLGAGVGVVLAAEHADRFRRFLIIGTRADATPEDEELWDARVAFASRHGMEAQGQQSVERWFGPAWIAAHPEQAEFVTKRIGQQSLQGYVANIAGLRKLNLWPHAKSIKDHGNGEKVVFVFGERDSDPVVADTTALAENTGSEIAVVQGAGHIANVQQPEEFHDLVRRVLA